MITTKGIKYLNVCHNGIQTNKNRKKIKYIEVANTGYSFIPS